MRTIKYFLVFIFTLIGIHFLLVFTGYDYIYTVLKMTVFKGRLGPAIDEYEAFHNDTVYPAEEPFLWPSGSDYNTVQLPEDLLQQHEKLQTIAYLVIKDDSVRHEFYREGFGSNSYSNSFSMAKSIVGTLTGIAIDEGYIDSLDQPAGDFLPYLNEGGYQKITVRHLLTMSPGINFDESYLNPFAFPAKANYGPDLIKLLKEYQPVEEPGITFSYQSGTSQLLAFVLEAATGKPAYEYAQEKLWKPLGAENPALWSSDEAGNSKAFCCFNSNARDFARFGYLYLHHGSFLGQRIVDSAYVAASVQPVDELKETNGEPNLRYGYHWWVHQNYKGMFDFFYMRGLKGQYVIVIPDKNMIVVRLGRHRQKRGTYELPKDVEYWIDGALEITKS